MQPFILIYASITVLLAQFMDWGARASGGGVGANKVAGGTPECLFGIPIAMAAGLFWYVVTGWVGCFALVPVFWAWTVWMGMERGHTRVYTMGGAAVGYEKVSTIERLGPQWVWERLFKRSIHTPAYSWWIMGIKGLLIGLPLGPFALLLAVLWPLAYWLAFRWDGFRDDGSSEWLSGGFARTVTISAVIASLTLIYKDMA